MNQRHYFHYFLYSVNILYQPKKEKTQIAEIRVEKKKLCIQFAKIVCMLENKVG